MESVVRAVALLPGLRRVYSIDHVNTGPSSCGRSVMGFNSTRNCT